MASRRRPDLRALRLAPDERGWRVAAVLLPLATSVVAVAQLVALTAAVLAAVAPGLQGLLEPPMSLGAATSTLAGSVLLRALLVAASRSAAARASAAVRGQVHERLLSAAARRGPVWAASPAARPLPSLLTTGLDVLDGWFAAYVPAAVAAVVITPAVLVVLAVIDLRSAVTVLATLPLVPLFGALVGIATARRASEQWHAGAAMSASFLDAVRGLLTAKLHGREVEQVAAVRRATEEHRVATVSVLRLAFVSSAALHMVATLSLGLLAVTCGVRLVEGEMGLATALLVLVLAPEAYRPLQEAAARFHDTAATGAVIDDVDAVLDAPAPVSLPPSEGLRLRGVSVVHPGRPELVLDALDLHVLPGEVVALTGPSGVGKTTVLRVAAGLVAPDAGEVGRAPRTAHLAQDPVFPLARSVAEAVEQGAPGADHDLLRRALELAAAHDLVASRGLHRPIGEDASGLSRGQRQRLGLARAFAAVLDGARVALLDEPTAHLDAAAEAAVLDGIGRLARERGTAVLLSAHREAAARSADRVVRLARSRGPAATPPPIPPPTRSSPPPALTSPDPSPSAPRLSRRVLRALGVVAGGSSTASSVALTAVAGWLLVTAAERPPLLSLSAAIVGVRFLALVRPVLRYLERLLLHDAALAGLAQRRADVYARLVPLVPGRSVPTRGEVLDGLVADVDAQVDGAVRGTCALTASALTVALAAPVLLVLAPGAAAALTGVAVVVLVAVLLAVHGPQRPRALAAARGRARARWAQDVVEVLDGLEDLVGSRGAGAPVAWTAPASAALHRAERRWARAAGLADASAVLVAGSLPLAGLLVVVDPVARGELSPAVAAAVVLGLHVLGEVPMAVPDAVRSVIVARSAHQRTERVLAAAPAATDPGAPGTPAGGSEVVARGVRASWVPGIPVLRDLDLELPAGARVVISGPSGSGKSTVGALLLRLLDRDAGDLHLAGADVARLTGRQVRDVVGAVGLADHVFAATVRDNVALARPGSSDEEVRAALAAAQLGPWLERLPLGLDTLLASSGADVSTGEARRLSMARAVLAGRRALVLDEPVEGLDPVTAAAVMDDLAAADPRTSWVLLAHRGEGAHHAQEHHRLEAGHLSAHRS